MSSKPEPRPAGTLLAALAFLTVAVIVLGYFVFDLRSDVDDLRSGARGRPPAGSASDGGAERSLQAGIDESLEDLRVCFNRALENSFEDFYRYAFGDETPPGVDKIVETCGTLSTRVKPVLYRGKLDFPVDMAWVPGTDTIFFTEKATGRVRVMHGRRLVDQPCATLPASAEGERGTLGIALHPDFDSNGYLYVYYTNAAPEENRVVRFTVENDRCTNLETLVTIAPLDTSLHNGGQLEIVDDKLFVSVGDGYSNPDLAQDQAGQFGKVLRYNLDGSIPDDNPFEEAGGPSPVWSFGHRNPFGLGHNPDTGRLYETENGPDCDDELNVIVEGENYGWGAGYECGSKGLGPSPRGSLVSWTPPIVPTDLWFYSGTTKSLAGYLYMGDFGAGKLHRFELSEDGDEVVKEDIVYDSPSQIVDVSEGPEGLLYFLTPDSIYRFVEE
jgi:glucose/arabinose dehydrogenase